MVALPLSRRRTEKATAVAAPVLVTSTDPAVVVPWKLMLPETVPPTPMTRLPVVTLAPKVRLVPPVTTKGTVAARLRVELALKVIAAPAPKVKEAGCSVVLWPTLSLKMMLPPA